MYVCISESNVMDKIEQDGFLWEEEVSGRGVVIKRVSRVQE